MGSIFDENSEFLKYLENKKNEKPEPAPIFKEDTKPTEMHIDDTKDESFTLNLKNVKLSDTAKTKEPAKPTPQPKQEKPNKKLEKVAKIKDRPTPTSNLAGWLFDKFKFLLTTAVIFLISFFALNWSAYSQIAKIWFDEIRGIENTSPLNVFTEERIANGSTATNEYILGSNFYIPPIDLEVTPPGTRIIIPRINSNVPVVNVSEDKLAKKDWSGLEQQIQDALRGGVVHYPGTPWPNQSGNVVVTGHSSYFPWDPGRFKDVFALLHQLDIGDEIIVFYAQQKYTYKVTQIDIVLPSEVEVLGDTGDDRLTLITCTPIGTNLKRLIVTAKPVDQVEQLAYSN